MSKGLKIVASLLAVMIAFTSCGGKAEQKQTVQADSKEDDKTLQLMFPQMIEREGQTTGGTFVYGYVNDTPWKGVFNSFLYQDNPTFEVMRPRLGKFMTDGPNHEIRDGYCTMTFDRETKTAIYRINDKLTWSDGVPVTAEDIIFVYECIGHPDYTGVRYYRDYENFVCMF